MNLASRPILFLVFCLVFNVVSSQIKVDQFGYTPDATKVAVLSNPQLGFNASDSYTPSATLQVRNNETNEVIFESSPQIWNGGATHDQSGDQGWWFDFSTVVTPGEYHIYDPQGISSYPFLVSDDVYSEVITASTKMFYYNRCNDEKLATHAGANWSDGMNFINPLQDSECRNIFDPTNASLQRDLSGGWFDAGDYNKYVTFAESAVHNLLWAYQENPEAFTDQTNIPESGNGIPDIIDELKWELDWLLKMVNPDGSVIIKMGAQNYAENVASPPSMNTDQRFYGNTCTSASLSAASMLSHAAEVFSSLSGMETYALQLQTEAELCFSYALPFIVSGTLETNCDNGEIVAGDADLDADEQLESAVTAAIHLFALTSNATYDNFLTQYAYQVEPVAAPFWAGYGIYLEDALLYYTSLPDGNAPLQQAITSAITIDSSNNWNGFYGFNNSDLYRAFMPDWSYHWGSNSPKAGFAILNTQLVNYGINTANASDYNLKAAEVLHYFHGVNAIDKVLISNMNSYGAENSIDEIYHGWFNDGTVYDNAQTSANGPAPGYVVGGPNASFSIGAISPPSGQPMQKAYKDWNTGFPENSWEISEPAIYYQAMYIRLLANFNDPCSNPLNLGCLDTTACNYNEAALCDDDSCEYVSCQGCLGDLNNDLTVTASDLTEFLANFGCIENCIADLNNDNQVTASDLTIFLSVFGAICD